MLQSSPDAGRDARRLGELRARRWWVSGRRVGSISRAAAFIDDVGFALLFPSPRHLVPSLWEAVAGADAEPFASGMNVNEQKVWRWKDELPLKGLAWYGNLVAGRASFLSPTMLSLLYTGAGAVDDHETAELSHTAHEIAAALANEPLPSATLRTLVGDRNRYQRAIVELQRQLLVTNAGVHEHPTGWPSALLDLTCRRFDVRGRTRSRHGDSAVPWPPCCRRHRPSSAAPSAGPSGRRAASSTRWWQRVRQRWTARSFAAAEREQWRRRD